MDGYFFIADLLGFGNIVRNSTSSELLERTARWTNLIDSLAKRYSIDNVQLISDTAFLSTESSSDGLKKLIKFARSLLNEGVPSSLAIRGAITHGEFHWGRLTYGKAVIEAHEIELSQNWIGVSCSSSLPHITNHWGYDSLIAYPTPFKQGPITIRPVVDWNIPRSSLLLKYLLGEGLVRDGESIPWALGEKLNNTVQFSIYKEVSKSTDASVDSFQWATGMDMIEGAILGK